MAEGIVWTEDIKFPGSNSSLLIDANSYNAWIRSTCLVCPPESFTEAMKLESPDAKYPIATLGPYDFHLKALPTYITRFSIFWGSQKVRTHLSIAQGSKRAEVSFTDKVVIPVMSKGSKREAGETRDIVWMSLTPLEIFSQRAAIKKARGRVLIAGLGMGWLTRRILERHKVKEVVQVEIDPHILEFFGKPLQNLFPKLHLINQNIYDLLSQINLNEFDSIIFDIWPRYGDARDDKRFKELKYSHPNVWGWGDVITERR